MKRRTLLAAIAAFAAIPLVGCSGISSGTGTSLSSDGAALDTSTLRVGLNRAPNGLDPSVGGTDLLRSFFEPLTTLDSDSELGPGLATSWSRKDDLTWTFTIREGATFSDGTPLTASTIKEYLDLLLAKDSTLATSGRWRAVVSGSQAVSDTTLEITTVYPYLGLPDRASSLYIGRRIDTAKTPAGEWIGTGPYVLQTIDLENGGKAVRNETYWGERPRWDSVEYQVLATEQARLLALQSHSVDVVTQINPSTATQLAGDDYYTTGSKASTWNIVLRFKEREGSPLNDIRVRQAINYGLDKQEIIDGALKGAVEPSPGQFLIDGWDYTNPNLSAFPHDVEKAKALLADAGYKDGISLRFDIPDGSYLAIDQTTQIIAAQLAEIGITLQLNVLPFAAWVDEADKDDVGDLIYIGHSTAYKFTPDRLAPFKSSYSQSHWQDPEYDAAADRALAVQDEAEQRVAIDEATQIFHDHVHSAFLFPQPVTWAARSGFDWEPRVDQAILPQDVIPAP